METGNRKRERYKIKQAQDINEKMFVEDVEDVGAQKMSKRKKEKNENRERQTDRARERERERERNRYKEKERERVWDHVFEHMNLQK